jgi:hypothetical protein
MTKMNDRLIASLESMQDTLTDISTAVERKRDALSDFVEALDASIRKLDDALEVLRKSKEANLF